MTLAFPNPHYLNQHLMRDLSCDTTEKKHLSSGASRQRRFFLMLQKCQSNRSLYQIHAQILLYGYTQKSSLLHKLLSCCITYGDLRHASLVFEGTENPSTTVWNQMIRGFSKSDTPEKALLLYTSGVGNGKKEGKEANGFTFSFLLNACSTPPFLREGQQLHSRIMRCGFISSVYVQTSLINMYASAGGEDDGIRRARRVFDNMIDKSVPTWNSMLAAYIRLGNIEKTMKIFDRMPERDVVSWTTVIAGCAQIGRSKQALALFHRMLMAGVEPDEVTMVAVLSACADIGDLELGNKIHSWVVENTYHNRRTRLVSLDNSLVNMYTKCGSIGEAFKIFQQMPRRNVVSWSTMIMGFVMHGCGGKALDIFRWMLLNTGERPDEVTFIGVLCACSQLGKTGLGLHYFKYMMQVCNVKPRIEHYGCIIDMLSRAGRVNEALKIIGGMPMEPNDVVWGALLSGCRVQGDLKLAGHVTGRLLELEEGSHTDLGGQLAHVANLYVGYGRWDEALWLRRMMVENGLKKPGGRSWVLVHGVVHGFMAGDQTRECDPVIFSKVKEMVERAKIGGRIPLTSQVLVDVDEEDKEDFLLLHSEKLALAFGLLSSVDQRIPIRILTNLRMCCDCHSVAELVSWSYNREIIIRERNNFHHFSEGTCSCKKYMQ